jgi:hypothetical protein
MPNPWTDTTTTTTTAAPTPAEVRELAARAERLAAAVAGMHDRLAAAGDEVRRAGYRLPDVAGSIEQAGAELVETAADLARVGAAPWPRS